MVRLRSAATMLARSDGSSDLGPATLSGVGHWTCGAVGLLSAVLVLALAYSLVVAVTSVVPLLSTTAIVMFAIAVWAVSWIVVEIVVVLSLRRRDHRRSA